MKPMMGHARKKISSKIRYHLNCDNYTEQQCLLRGPTSQSHWYIGKNNALALIYSFFFFFCYSILNTPCLHFSSTNEVDRIKEVNPLSIISKPPEISWGTTR